MTDTAALFDWLTTPQPPGLSADQRRTHRQTARLAHGVHPLGIALHPYAAPADDRTAPGRRCGSCAFRRLRPDKSRRYPKCTYTPDGGTTYPRITNGAATDVRRWWPACTDHEYGAPELGRDAARSGPPDDEEPTDDAAR